MKFSPIVMLVGGLALLLRPAGAKEKSSCAQGVCVKVLGQSGKISMAAVDSVEDIDGAEGRVTVSMDGLREVDAAGKQVGKSGKTKHSINSFASQEFVFSDITSGDFQGVAADTFNFESTLNGLSSKVQVAMYIFQEDGNITLGDETQLVRNGSVKFCVELTSWEFCGCSKGASEEEGAFIDFDLQIKGHGNASQAETEDDSEGFDLGGDAKLKLSKKVEIDGTWQDMEQGYPLLEDKGGKQTFTFRFNKFSSKAYYDPTIELGAGSPSGGADPDVVTPEPTPGGAHVVLASSLFMLGALVLTVLF